MAGNTFTTYLNAKRSNALETEFSALEQRAGKTLTAIQGKADLANRAISGLIQTTGRGVRSPIGSDFVREAQRASNALREVEERERRLERENSSLVRGLRTTATTLGVVQGPLGPIAGRLTAAADAVARLSGVTLGLAGAGAALFAYVSAANRFVDIRSKLAPLYDTQQDVNKALGEVAGIATRARTGLEPVVDLYSRLKLAADQYGISQQRVGRITELASKATRLSGGTAQSQEAGLYQFAQGFGSGSLGGDELKSIRENAFGLARALSQGLSKLPEFKGIDVSVGKLKELGATGKLTADVIARALEASAGDIEAAFSKLPPTIGTSMTQLSTAATLFVGNFEKATGIVGGLASGLLLVANNIGPIVAGLGGIAGGYLAVAAAAKLADASANAKGFIANIQAQTNAAKAALDVAKGQQSALLIRMTGLQLEEQQIRKNVVAMEAELAVTREQRALAENSAAIAPFGPGRREAAALIEKEAGQTKALATEIERLSVTSSTGADVSRRYAGATETVAKATATAAAKGGLFKQGLVALLGAINPLGIAVGLATTAFLSWAFAESEAEKNAKKVEDAQRSLAKVIDFTTGKIIEQNSVILANAKLTASDGIHAAAENYRNIKGQITGLASTIQGDRAQSTTGLNAGFTGTQNFVSAGQQKVLDAINRYSGGQITVQQLQSQVEALAKADPALQSYSDKITRLAGDAQTASRKVGELASTMKILNGQASDEDRRRANGDFSGGRNAAVGQRKTQAQLNADAEALAIKLQDKRFAALTQRDESLKRLDAQRASANSKMSDEDYTRERAQILNTYKLALDGIDNKEERAKAADQRAADRAERAHQAELRRIEVENQKREARTDKRKDILGAYSEEPKMIVKAQRDIRELNELVGETMNGLVAVSKTNPLGQGIYTQAMANADAARIQDGLDRPFRKYLEGRERDLTIQGLILQGHDLEAQALQKGFELYDETGKLTYGQYQTILNNLKAEQQINDALAQRERILAPLRDSVNNIRNDLTQAIDQIFNGGSPLTAGKNLFKSLFAQFTQANATNLVEKLTGGLDQRVRDLISGKTAVDGAIADYIGNLQETGSVTGTLRESLGKVATSADNAATALSNLSTTPVGTADAQGGLALGGSSSVGSSVASILAAVPKSYFKAGVSVGNGIGQNIIYDALGGKGLITENRRSQATQNSFFSRGLTTARVSDHTTSDDAFDVRLPAGMSFATATRLIKESAAKVGASVVKALDETSSGGTGSHGHYVIRGGSNVAPAAAAPPIGQLTTTAVATVGSKLLGVNPGIIGQTLSAVGTFARRVFAGRSSTTPTTVDPETGDVIVTGRRAVAAPASAGTSGLTTAREIYNHIGADFGAKLDKTFGTKFLSGIGSKLGDALGGAQTGAMVAGVGKMLWSKFSTTGSQIGGAIGAALPIPGGDIIGSIIGGTIGGLLKKTKKGGVTVTGSGGEINVGAAFGNDAGMKKAATDGGNSLSGGISKIADALNATLGNFSITIGQYKGKWRVNTTGGSQLGGKNQGPGITDFGTDGEAAAVEFALREAIKQGALTGISAASKVLLTSGKDLETQLRKAQIIESIPKRLMALKDPVKAAIMDLNDEFSKMIAYLKEGGATAEQFAQAQELYDLSRQKAIEQASQSSIDALQKFIDEMTGGSSSPLNKLTVYQNASEQLARFSGDIKAGKTVDNDKFLEAASKFQDASRELNGSSQSFFTDFDYLLGLLNQAKANTLGATTSSDPATRTDLPGSPFSATDIQAIIHGSTSTTDAVNTQTDVLSGQLTDILSALGGRAGAGGGGAIDLLPSSGGGIGTARNLVTKVASL